MDLLGLKDKIKTELRDISNDFHEPWIYGPKSLQPSYFRLEQYKAIISLILIYADKNYDDIRNILGWTHSSVGPWSPDKIKYLNFQWCVYFSWIIDF